MKRQKKERGMSKRSIIDTKYNSIHIFLILLAWKIIAPTHLTWLVVSVPLLYSIFYILFILGLIFSTVLFGHLVSEEEK